MKNINLDDPKTFKQYDPEGMLARIHEMPWQCQQAWQAAMSFSLPPDYANVDEVVILGMGGSAIGGDLVRSLAAAEAKLPIKYGGITVSENELIHVFAFFVLYLAVMLVSALLLAFAGFTLPDALFESASAVGTVGLSSGVTSPDLALWAKALLIFEMWAGRLEIFPVLVVLYWGTWKWRRRSA